MSNFYSKSLPDPVDLRILPNRRKNTKKWWQVWKKKRSTRNYFEVIKAFRFESDWSSYQDMGVPVGFKTDLASIPRMARSFISVIEDHMVPAIVHDYLYRETSMAFLGKPFADKLFLTLMEEMGVPKSNRIIMYNAVKFGGKGSYQKG